MKKFIAAAAGVAAALTIGVGSAQAADPLFVRVGGSDCEKWHNCVDVSLGALTGGALEAVCASSAPTTVAYYLPATGGSPFMPPGVSVTVCKP